MFSFFKKPIIEKEKWRNIKKHLVHPKRIRFDDRSLLALTAQCHPTSYRLVVYRCDGGKY